MGTIRNYRTDSHTEREREREREREGEESGNWSLLPRNRLRPCFISTLYDAKIRFCRLFLGFVS